MSATWAGVDVGAARKGFHLALIDDTSVVAGPRNCVTVDDALHQLVAWQPSVIAVDSPRRAAGAGELSRADERAFAAARICGIRFTPHEDALNASAYYAWVLHGFRLYDALADTAATTKWRVIECFPTAAWSCLGSARGTTSRAQWSAAILQQQGLGSVPARLSQDGRDAIGAALTARLDDRGQTDKFGEIVVPRRGHTRSLS